MTGPEAERLGRRMALHLRKNQFTLCREILEFAEQEHGDSLRDTLIENIAETGLDLKLINRLESEGYLKIADLGDVTDEDLLAMDWVGEVHLSLIRYAVDAAVRHNVEVQYRRDACETL